MNAPKEFKDFIQQRCGRAGVTHGIAYANNPIGYLKQAYITEEKLLAALKLPGLAGCNHLLQQVARAWCIAHPNEATRVRAAIVLHQSAEDVIPVTDDDMAKVQAALAQCTLGGTTGTREEKAAALLPIDDMSRVAVSLVVSAACQWWEKKSFQELTTQSLEFFGCQIPDAGILVQIAIGAASLRSSPIGTMDPNLLNHVYKDIRKLIHRCGTETWAWLLIASVLDACVPNSARDHLVNQLLLRWAWNSSCVQAERDRLSSVMDPHLSVSMKNVQFTKDIPFLLFFYPRTGDVGEAKETKAIPSSSSSSPSPPSSSSSADDDQEADDLLVTTKRSMMSISSSGRSSAVLGVRHEASSSPATDTAAATKKRSSLAIAANDDVHDHNSQVHFNKIAKVVGDKKESKAKVINADAATIEAAERSKISVQAKAEEKKKREVEQGWADHLRNLQSALVVVNKSKYKAIQSAAMNLAEALNNASGTTRFTGPGTQGEMPTDDEIVWLTDWAKETYPVVTIQADRLSSAFQRDFGDLYADHRNA